MTRDSDREKYKEEKWRQNDGTDRKREWLWLSDTRRIKRI